MTINPRIRQAGAGTAVLVAAGLSYLYLYDAPKRDLERKTEQQIGANRGLEGELRDQRRVDEALKAFAATTLGGSTGEVAARFRSALNDIAGQCGLAEVMVNSRNPTDQFNPGGISKVSSPSGLRATLKKQKDFSVISGDLEGKGTLEQVLRATATVQAQPWVHRVDSFAIKPEGKERDVFSLKLGVSTILMPDLAPKAAPEVQIKAVEPSAGLAAIIEKNMFKEPAPVVVRADLPSEAANGVPPPPPYADWKLTGVIESRLGVEAFMLNVRSGERVTLPTGAVVADARFVSGKGETAVFEIGGQQYEVLNGQTLQQRRPR